MAPLAVVLRDGQPCVFSRENERGACIASHGSLRSRSGCTYICLRIFPLDSSTGEAADFTVCALFVCIYLSVFPCPRMIGGGTGGSPATTRRSDEP